MTAERDSPGARGWSGDAGAKRLLALVRSGCAEGEDLPARLEAGLRVALRTLVAEPELAYQLTVDPYLGMGEEEEALSAQRVWLGRFGDLLRDAAAADPRASDRGPALLAPFLIGGVRFQVARLVLAGEGSELMRLLPGTLEALLGYYFEPGEPPRLAQAALHGPG